MIPVLNNGFVELKRLMGGDQAIIEAARICYQSESTSDIADKRLIAHLINKEHKTPLEHCVFTFKIKAPIFVVRQWQRHRIGSFNEKSLRYCEASPQFYVPDNLTEEQEETFISNHACCWHDYIEMTRKNIPKEQARTLLPLGIYTEFIWTVNASSLYNFLKLRLDTHAQYEIREYAKAILELAKEVAPITFGLVAEKLEV